MDVSRALLRSVPLKRDTYVKLPDVVEKENSARNLLKPLYGMSTACKGWHETIRDFLEKECGRDVTSLWKSVLCWAQRGFDYGYGEKFRAPDQTNLDRCILKVNENSETDGERKSFRIIVIRCGDLLISGSDGFIEYISWKLKEMSDVDSYGGVG